MSNALVLTVRLHDGRYHGRGDWPPSPARLFQALVAGAARGAALAREDREALCWLERLPPPEIVAPPARPGQRVVSYVPNNDLDAVGGELTRVGEIRVAKVHEARLFESGRPFLYVWLFDDSPGSLAQARLACDLASRLFQLGRGIDMACAEGVVLRREEAASRLEELAGSRYWPTGPAVDTGLQCPTEGSLASLEARFRAFTERIAPSPGGKGWRFAQPPKPLFARVAYGSPLTYQMFELRSLVHGDAFRPWPQQEASSLIVRLRDRAVERLSRAWPHRGAVVERALVGRDSVEADKRSRVRILPLPSIGHDHADRAIRRVLVEVSADCPLSAADVFWGFSGTIVEQAVDPDTGEVLRDTRLLPAVAPEMLRHYGIAEPREPSRWWRTVTPAALPPLAARRRIDPRRSREEAKGGRERAEEEARAVSSVVQALRHAGVAARVTTVRVQREPFARNGRRAEAFADGTRFGKERLWHVEVSFAEPVAGPLVIGDGRYLGLGLMAPTRLVADVLGFRAGPIPDNAVPTDLCRALRRAVMARVQARLGPRQALPLFFSGHAPDGAPARSGHHAHLAFVADLARSRLLVLAPHVLEHRTPTREERTWLTVLDAAMSGFRELRIGGGVSLEIGSVPIESSDDLLFAPAECWESVTDYTPTRHSKADSLTEGLAADARRELQRRGMPVHSVDVLAADVGSRGGQRGRLRLRFARPVAGPILLGRTCHFGGGLFAAAG